MRSRSERHVLSWRFMNPASLLVFTIETTPQLCITYHALATSLHCDDGREDGSSTLTSCTAVVRQRAFATLLFPTAAITCELPPRLCTADYALAYQHRLQYLADARRSWSSYMNERGVHLSPLFQVIWGIALCLSNDPLSESLHFWIGCSMFMSRMYWDLYSACISHRRFKSTWRK
ncbi:hypothetical protein K461DRAFT_182664 [Myriangium duriaei CBS 260.36]|uniref:Uncharacterized protein n=1 Tax=Myriangium duriaei CBS 260.36 TaxID=1168546 RepID=A0A9P4J011_9PEZI|nr:hypothetical protein K461DRAFT_182664 [Myriangium duriaei CBS 260.36]